MRLDSEATIIKELKELALFRVVPGVIGGPMAMIIRDAAGVAVGNLITSLTHTGIAEDRIEWIEPGLELGSGAVFAIVEAKHHHLILNNLEEVGAVTISESIESAEFKDPIIISPGGGKTSAQ